MNINEIIEIFKENINPLVGFLLVISVFVEIAPIQINPWSHILKTIGKLMNSDLEEKVGVLDEKLKCLDNEIKEQKDDIKGINTKIDYNKFENSRYRIIRVFDEYRAGHKISNDHAIQITDDINIYKEFCYNNPDFQNSRGKTAMKGLEQAYIDGTLTDD